MKDYKQIEHITKYIGERMKHCYDIGYEQGSKDEKEIHEGCDDVIRAFYEGILIGSMRVPKENVPQFPLSDKCCCEKGDPKQRLCKDCKWWKDSDGIYRRGIGAETQCPINRKEVYEGNGYCYMFKPKMEGDKNDNS